MTTIQPIQPILKSAEKFFNDLTLDENHRYLSWEHCYQQFGEARKNADPDIDYLSLHLAFYLASWGMLRGSSFLLQKDYRVHIPAVKEILKPEYQVLFGLKCEQFEDDNVKNALKTLYTNLENIYGEIRKTVENKEEVKQGISAILLTKILLGTLGCSPAYDEFFVKGVKKTEVTTGRFSVASLEKLAKFYLQYADEFEPLRAKMKHNGVEYPPMKLLDMAFWSVGFEKA